MTTTTTTTTAEVEKLYQLCHKCAGYAFGNAPKELRTCCCISTGMFGGMLAMADAIAEQKKEAERRAVAAARPFRFI